MEICVTAPLSGRVSPLTDVPDEVFAQQMLGPGIALLANDLGEVTVLAPTAGRIRTVLPHAFVLELDSSHSLLVHLGVDTFRLNPKVFQNLVGIGTEVKGGTGIIRWDMAASSAQNVAPWVTISVLGDPQLDLQCTSGYGKEVASGSALFSFEI